MKRINYNNFIGKVYNNLEILDVVNPPINVKDKRKYFKCKCLLCGKIKYINSKNVISGLSKSCGCSHFGMKQSKTLNQYIDYGNYIVGICTNIEKNFYIDKEDYERVKKYTWHLHEGNYVRTCLESKNRKNKYCFLHNFIIGNIPDNYVIDHINGNPLDNRKNNLRIIKQINNAKNLKIYSNNTSGVKGVCYFKNTNKWQAYITYNKVRLHLGSYTNKQDAIKARKEAEIKYFKEYNRKEEYLNNEIK